MSAWHSFSFTRCWEAGVNNREGQRCQVQVQDYKGNGGESGIRTHVTLSSKHAFQACAFSHSAISPATGRSFREASQEVNAGSEILFVIALDYFRLDFMAWSVEPQP